MDEVGNWGDRCTLNCGSCLWGIPVRIHYTYFILWVVEVIITAAHYHLIQYTMVVFLLYGPVLLVTILIVSGMSTRMLQIVLFATQSLDDTL
jgi:hypothetical protein